MAQIHITIQPEWTLFVHHLLWAGHLSGWRSSEVE